jgi:hypothetical protein
MRIRSHITAERQNYRERSNFIEFYEERGVAHPYRIFCHDAGRYGGMIRGEDEESTYNVGMCLHGGDGHGYHHSVEPGIQPGRQ